MSIYLQIQGEQVDAVWELLKRKIETNDFETIKRQNQEYKQMVEKRNQELTGKDEMIAETIAEKDKTIAKKNQKIRELELKLIEYKK